MELRQLDVKTAFLQSELQEEVYVQPPPGLEQGEGQRVVYRLRRALYGLKQAPRAWHQKLKTVLTEMGFVPSKVDPCLYIKETDQGKILLLTYVDDLLIAAKTNDMVESVVRSVQAVLDVRDMGEATMFLNLSIERDRQAGLLKLHQRQQIEALVAAYGLENCTAAATPLPVGINFTALPNDPARLVGEKLTQYQALLGSINYIAGNTRPDISHAAGVLARALRSPTVRHWTAGLQVLRYLKGTSDQGIQYRQQQKQTLVCYHDADFGADVDNRKSISGYVWLCGSGAVSWKSQQQKVAADSTTEAEYVAATAAFKEGLWLQKMLVEFTGEHCQLTAFCDNSAAVKVIHKGVYEAKTKHMSVKYHYMHQHVALGELQLLWVNTNEMLADCLTKQVSREKLKSLTKKMGMI